MRPPGDLSRANDLFGASLRHTRLCNGLRSGVSDRPDCIRYNARHASDDLKMVDTVP